MYHHNIINWDEALDSGTLWVYFDPFKMPPPIEVVEYIRDIKYNDIQYQDTKRVLCGYYCLCFLERLNDGYKIYDVLWL